MALKSQRISRSEKQFEDALSALLGRRFTREELRAKTEVSKVSVRTFNRYVKEYRRVRILRIVRYRESTGGRPAAVYRVDSGRLAARQKRYTEEYYRGVVSEQAMGLWFGTKPYPVVHRMGWVVSALFTVQTRKELRERRTVIARALLAHVIPHLRSGEMLVVGPFGHTWRVSER